MAAKKLTDRVARIATSDVRTVSLVAASGRRIGVLCVADKQVGEFTPNDERVLVQRAAVGLENARLYIRSSKRLSAIPFRMTCEDHCAIAGFTGLLRDRHYETIDADGRRCIDRVLAGTQRMSNLIDD